MRVAILGTRGIPASYSGFETAAEQLASRLTQRGHEVIVYCRPHVVDRRLKEHKGARLVHMPTVRNKYLDTFTHTLLSSLHTARRVRPDVAPFFIAGERARGMKLVVVGGAPYAHDYIKQVQRAGDPRVIFPGYVFGKGYWELQRHAYVFCAPTEVGGTHPVILEALAAGNCVLVNDHAPNVETVGEAGVTFSGDVGVPSLQAQLERLFDEPELVAAYRDRARERAMCYSWDG